MLVVAAMVLFIAAAIIASVVSLIQSARSDSEAFHHRLETVNLFSQQKNLSASLRARYATH